MLFFFFLLPFLAYGFIVFEPRYYFSYFPILLVWVAAGLEAFRNWLKESFGFGEKQTVWVASGVCLFLVLASGVYLQSRLSSVNPPLYHKELGLWMKKNLPRIEDETVVARPPYVNFYTGARMLRDPYLPYVEKFEDFLVYLIHHKARYFVVGEDLEYPVLESYRFLLDETQPPPAGISRVHTVKGEKKLILYEVLGV